MLICSYNSVPELESSSYSIFLGSTLLKTMFICSLFTPAGTGGPSSRGPGICQSSAHALSRCNYAQVVNCKNISQRHGHSEWSGPALRNFKLKCKWILTLTSSIYSPTIYNLNTQWNWFKHNVWWRNELYLSLYISHKNPQSSEFKMVDNENSNGFSKTHSRDLLREPFESFVTVRRPKVRSASGFTAGEEGKGCPPLQDLNSEPYHKIITGTQSFWVANGLPGITRKKFNCTTMQNNSVIINSMTS